MKIWKSFFLWSTLVCGTLFILSQFILIQNSYNITLNNNIKKDISNTKHLQLFLESTILDFLNTPDPEEPTSEKDILFTKKAKTFISIKLNEYLKYSKDTYVEFTDDHNKKIYSNFPFDIAKREELENKSKHMKYIIRDIQNKEFIFIVTPIKVNSNQNYILTYISDISDTFLRRTEDYKFSLNLLIIFIILMGTSMLIISKKLSKSITELINKINIFKDENKICPKFNKKTFYEIKILENEINTMQESLKENLKILREESENKQNFIQSFTHELKTPLTSIIGYSDFLLNVKNIDSETNLKCLNYIKSEGKRLENLSFVLMDLFLITGTSINKKTYSTNSLIIDCINSITPKANMRKISLLSNINDFKLFVDEELFKVLLLNLIDNAIKASSENSTIIINSYLKDSKKYIEIIDFGIGIPKKDLDKIKEPFYVVDKSRAKKNQGVGLGMSIVYKICDLLKITITIESELNKGTKVTLCI